MGTVLQNEITYCQKSNSSWKINNDFTVLFYFVTSDKAFCTKNDMIKNMFYNKYHSKHKNSFSALVSNLNLLHSLTGILLHWKPRGTAKPAPSPHGPPETVGMNPPPPRSHPRWRRRHHDFYQFSFHACYVNTVSAMIWCQSGGTIKQTIVFPFFISTFRTHQRPIQRTGQNDTVITSFHDFSQC